MSSTYLMFSLKPYNDIHRQISCTHVACPGRTGPEEPDLSGQGPMCVCVCVCRRESVRITARHNNPAAFCMPHLQATKWPIWKSATSADCAPVSPSPVLVGCVCVCCVWMSNLTQVSVGGLLVRLLSLTVEVDGKRNPFFFLLLLKNIIWEWRTSRMYPTVCPDWNFLERGVWLRTLRRSTVFYYLCDQSDARSQVGELSFISGRPWAWRRYKARLLEKLSYLFFCFLFFCMCLWAHPRRVFDRKAANMLLFAHKYGAGMTLSRLWMYSCQDNSQATAAPELDLYTSAQNAGVMVGRICPWLLLTSSYDLQRLDLVGVEPAAALCDV